jgi:hypothetical protein
LNGGIKEQTPPVWSRDFYVGTDAGKLSRFLRIHHSPAARQFGAPERDYGIRAAHRPKHLRLFQA